MDSWLVARQLNLHPLGMSAHFSPHRRKSYGRICNDVKTLWNWRGSYSVLYSLQLTTVVTQGSIPSSRKKAKQHQLLWLPHIAKSHLINLGPPATDPQKQCHCATTGTDLEPPVLVCECTNHYSSTVIFLLTNKVNIGCTAQQHI